MNFLKTLNMFDYLTISIILISGILSFFKGLSKSMILLLRTIATSCLTYFLAPYCKIILESYFKDKVVIATLSYLIPFLIIAIILTILAYYVLNKTSKLRSGGLDMSLGFCYGVTRGLIVTVLIFMTIGFTYSAMEIKKGKYGEFLVNKKEDFPEWISKSKSYNALNLSSTILVSILPEGFFKNVAKDFKEEAKTSQSYSDLISNMYNNLPRKDVKEVNLNSSLIKKLDGIITKLSEPEKENLKKLIELYKKASIQDKKLKLSDKEREKLSNLEYIINNKTKKNNNIEKEYNKIEDLINDLTN